MSSAQASELFNCTPQEFYAIISSYEKYPEFLAEVKECKVVEKRDNQKLIEFNISLIKTFKYRLWMTEKANQGINWVLDSGDLFKVSNGSWDIKEEAGKTRAVYAVEAKFKVFVPGPIAKALVSVNLPNMMSSYHRRVKELYGK